MTLLDRLKTARGPDSTLDGELMRLFDGAYWKLAIQRASMPHGAPRDVAEREAVRYAPQYTGSIDSALRLLPGDCSWRVGNLPSGGGFAMVGTSLREYEGASPALALCIACVAEIEALPMGPTFK